MTTENPAPAPAPRRRRRAAPPQPEVQTPSQPRQEPTSAGPSVHTGVGSWFPGVMAIAVIVLTGLQGFQFYQQLKRQPGGSSPAPVVQHVSTPAPWDDLTLDQKWACVAQWVESGQVLSTDELVIIGRQLQKSGYMEDISRLDVYAREKSKPITADNRAEVLRVVRGGIG